MENFKDKIVKMLMQDDIVNARDNPTCEELKKWLRWYDKIINYILWELDERPVKKETTLQKRKRIAQTAKRICNETDRFDAYLRWAKWNKTCQGVEVVQIPNTKKTSQIEQQKKTDKLRDDFIYN